MLACAKAGNRPQAFWAAPAADQRRIVRRERLAGAGLGTGGGRADDTEVLGTTRLKRSRRGE
jgi:hypothetical protein